jgi:hypothetical protein
MVGAANSGFPQEVINAQASALLLGEDHISLKEQQKKRGSHQ